jgi:phage I-like protein
MDKLLNTSALSALMLPISAAGHVPEWLRLVPNGTSKAYDGRGEFHYDNAARVIETSFGFSPRIHIDVNHSTESAAKIGAPSEAHGYIVEMEEREDGIWGRVDWNPSGTALMQNRSYWGASPVLMHDTTGKIHAIKSLALTNDPALRGLTALSAKPQENGMDILKILAELGLDADASEADVTAEIKALKEAKAAKTEVAEVALSAVAGALGLETTATQAEVIATAATLAARDASVTALQAQNAALSKDNARHASEVWLQTQLSAGAAVPKGMDATYVDLHMDNPELAEKLVGSLPKLTGTPLSARTPPKAIQTTALSAEQRQVADAMGISHDDFMAQLDADAKAKEAL